MKIHTKQGEPTTTVATGLLRRTHHHLQVGFGTQDEEDVDVELEQTPFLRLNVTLRTNGVLRGSMSGVGVTLDDQLRDATRRAASDNRFTGAITYSDLENVHVELWLQLSREPIVVEQRNIEDAFILGVEGLEIEEGSASAYYKPSVAITSSFKTPQIMLSALCKKAGLEPDAWSKEDCSVWKSAWSHICDQQQGKGVLLSALRPMDSPAHLILSDMNRWVERGAQYLLKSQNLSGSITYEYSPLHNAVTQSPLNYVREAGCAYAMAAAASLLGSADIRKATGRLIDGILARMSVLNPDASFIADEVSNVGKLGTSALTLLALKTSAMRTSEYDEPVRTLTNAIYASQKADGSFHCSFGGTQTADTQQDYFPGQALLSLLSGHISDRSMMIDSLRRAFPFYSSRFISQPSTAFVGWQIEVWKRAYDLDARPEYAAFALRQAEWLLQFQLFSRETHPLYRGGFVKQSGTPNYSTIVYTEALAHAAGLAHQLHDPLYARLSHAFTAGLAFCNRLWIVEEQSIFFPHPQRAIGGVTRSISNLTIRADVVQHAITLALAAINVSVLF